MMMNHANKVRYIESNRIGDSILTFKEPSDDVIEKIGSILESLKIKSFNTSQVTTHSSDEAIRGNRKEVIGRLKKVLVDDYDDNISDTDINFDYHIFKSNQQPDAIHIKTRLFYPGNDGDILYGRMIQRIAEDDYLLWVDD